MEAATYLNSGDWIENLSALEYDKGEWSIYQYNKHHYQLHVEDEDNLNDLSINRLITKVTATAAGFE